MIGGLVWGEFLVRFVGRLVWIFHYPKVVKLSTLNELSGELSCGLMWRVQAEISG